ncbi:MAG TPA: O-antigen ligase family protein [Devosiaceae bacterium]|nr:O-antigen ligase family protein [Devosiaceae bacterium]
MTLLVVQILPFGRLFGPFAFHAESGAVLYSDTLSVSPGTTILMIVRLLGYGLFSALLVQAAATRATQRWRMLQILFGVTVAYAILGLLSLFVMHDTLLGTVKWAYPGTATGPFVNRNSFATFLAFGLVSGTALLCGLKRTRYQRQGTSLHCLGLLIVASALLATQSRMGCLAGALGLSVVLAAAAARARLNWQAIAALCALGVAAAGALLGLFGGALLERLGSLDSDSDVRGDLYHQILGMIWQRPLLGWGGGSFETAFPLVHVPPLSTDLVWDKAHSTYLALWTELGLVVGTLPTIACLLLGARMFKTLRRNGPEWSIAVAALGVLAVAALHSAVDFSLEIEANTFLFLAILTLGAALPTEHSPDDPQKIGVEVGRIGAPPRLR